MTEIVIRPQDRSAATRIGVPVEIYVAKRAEGLRWCSFCKQFLPGDQVAERECKACAAARGYRVRAKRAAKRRDCE